MNKFTKKTAYVVLAVLMLVGFTAVWTISPPWSQSNEGSVVISGNTPQALNQSRLVGHSNPQQKIDVVVGLKLRNEKDLDDLIARQSDPKSPDFRHFITPQQFEQQYAPTSQDVKKVVAHLKKSGLTVVEVSSNRLLVHVRGTVQQIEKAFNVNINIYRYAGKEVISNDRDPSVPAELADVVQSVMGLNTFAQFHSRLKHTHGPVAQDSASGFGPKDIATAYNFPNANNSAASNPYSGKGVTIAIATAYTYDSADAEAYWKHYGVVRTGTITNVPVNGTTTQLDGETTLDLEQAGAQAPGADIIMYLGKDPSFATFAKVFNQIVTDNKASVASVSWGLCEENTGKAEMATEHTIFKVGTAQGITFFAAAGDDGAYDNSDKPQDYAVDYPSSDPFVTAVGGTALKLNGDGTRKSEEAWSGAGGGVSTQYDRPSWQTGPGVPAGGKRASSDVALNADPATGFSIYFESGWDQAGGTSFSSPDWAGLWALAIEANGGRLGYAGPALYRLGASPDYGKAFYDVTAGNNGNGAGPGYSAGTGWDHPTGWGSPDGSALIQWLLNDKATAAQPAAQKR